MKSGACPKCKSREQYVIEQATQPDLRRTYGVAPTAIVAVYAEKGVVAKGREFVSINYAVHVCAKCGYFESYVTNLALLGQLAAAGAGTVRKL